MVEIITFTSGPYETNGYLLRDGKEALLIDAPPGILEMLPTDISLQKVLLTHSHLDHTADAAELVDKFQSELLVHPLDSPNVEQPGSDGLPRFLPVRGVKPTGLLQEGDKLSFGNASFEVIHTPGHTPGGISLYSPELKLLFSGDTLFQGTIGNLSFPGCDEEKMWESLKKLARLPPDTVVYPGHGPTTTIGREWWLSDARNHFGS